MFFIEDVTGRNFLKEGKHMSFWPNPTKKPLVAPARVSSPPRVHNSMLVTTGPNRRGPQCLPLFKNRKELVVSFSNVDPQSSCLNLLARRHKQNLNRNVMHDLNN
jgi:hypothetical protein